MQETLTCDCGRIWKLTKHSLIFRDDDSINCKCGRLLKKWNGAQAWTAELIKGLPEDEISN